MILYLVRHAAVELREEVPAPDWQLSAEGRAAAEQLAQAPVWKQLTLIASSPEPKAWATAKPIAAAAGLDLQEEADLREVSRPFAPINRTAYVALVQRYLAGEPIPGWEPRDTARARIESCIARLVDRAIGPRAVVSHGLVLSLYLGLAHEEWQRVPLPAVAAVDRERRLVRAFGPNPPAAVTHE